ncbi:MAG: MotA/TolQ/ExbB proton channel family protein, partial [Pseudomonadota bacterium]
LLRTRVAPPTMIEHLAKGGVWIVPIFAFALLATVIAIGKSVQFARLPKLQPILPSAQTAGPGFMDQLQGAQREVVRVAQAAASSEQRDDMLFSLLLGERAKLERFLGAIAVTATVSPLLGLLGTVSGMITTFNMMTLFGAGDPAVVSGGISEALVTTELGLIVAIPALILHALLSRKATAYAEGLEASAIALTQQQAVVTVVPSS